MSDFQGTCDNTEKLAGCSFMVWDKNGKPARLDTVNDTLRGTASGGGSVNILPEDTFTDPVTGVTQPRYNFELVSGTSELETIDVALDCDGQPGPGVVAFHATGVLEVAPTPANSGAFVIGQAVPKNQVARRR